MFLRVQFCICQNILLNLSQLGFWHLVADLWWWLWCLPGHWGSHAERVVSPSTFNHSWWNDPTKSPPALARSIFMPANLPNCCCTYSDALSYPRCPSNWPTNSVVMGLPVTGSEMGDILTSHRVSLDVNRVCTFLFPRAYYASRGNVWFTWMFNSPSNLLAMGLPHALQCHIYQADTLVHLQPNDHCCYFTWPFLNTLLMI